MKFTLNVTTPPRDEVGFIFQGCVYLKDGDSAFVLYESGERSHFDGEYCYNDLKKGREITPIYIGDTITITF